jgi:hypothetical protein
VLSIAQLPVLSMHHKPCDLANIDLNGRLADNTWRLNTAPTDKWTTESTSNTLREEIVDKNHYAHERNYK